MPLSRRKGVEKLDPAADFVLATSSKAIPLSRVDLLSALGVVVIWGFNFVAMKFGLRYFTPFQMGAARFAVAAFPLVLILRRPSTHWKWIVLYGLFQGVGQFGLLFVALRVGMTAALASVLMQTQVFFTALFGVTLLHERLGFWQRWALVVAALGLSCFVMDFTRPAKSSALAATTAFGFVLNLGAAAMWAASNVIARRAQDALHRLEPLNFVAWSSLVPVLPFIALSLIWDEPGTRGRWLQANWQAWASIVYLGWMATSLAYGLWTGLLKRHPANAVAPFSLAIPVIGVAAGILTLGESVTPWQWAGIALLLLALGCVMLAPRYFKGGIGRERDAGG